MANTSKRATALLAGIGIEVCAGIGYAWSVFQNPLIDKYGWTTSAVSVAFTLFILAGAIAPLVGKLQEYLRTRTIVLIGAVLYGASLYATGTASSIPALYLSFGLGVGVGTTTIYPLLISYMIKLFPEKKGLISGVMVASYGSGAVLLAPIGAWLTSQYGVSNAFKILGVGLFIIIAAASRLIDDVRDIRTEMRKAAPSASPARKVRDLTWRQMLATPRFYVAFTALTIGATSGLMILGHASPMIQSTMGIPAQQAAFIVSILAVSNTVGRLFLGGFSDRVGRYPLMMMLFACSTLSFVTLAASDWVPLFLTGVLLVEFCYGGYIALIAPVTADLFGTRHLSINYGIMFLSFAIGGVIGPRLAAVIKETYDGSYQMAFIIAAALCVVGLGLALAAGRMRRRQRDTAENSKPIAA
ncbi:MAG: OFA family MFS transporter [Acidobacteriota bacterium]|jgi:OFA family oxalate/formate antiporter-like MFS transporter|nr:OFA family MFS transporter [Acidobacteriota bacterium]NLT32368.1 OFA family MFS transporter [Acidobacteriota bacterium]